VLHRIGRAPCLELRRPAGKLQQPDQVGRLIGGFSHFVDDERSPGGDPFQKRAAGLGRDLVKRSQWNRHDVERRIVDPRFGEHLRSDDLKIVRSGGIRAVRAPARATTSPSRRGQRFNRQFELRADHRGGSWRDHQQRRPVGPALLRIGQGHLLRELIQLASVFENPQLPVRAARHQRNRQRELLCRILVDENLPRNGRGARVVPTGVGKDEFESPRPRQVDHADADRVVASVGPTRPA
jgi:hypothetical protein